MSSAQHAAAAAFTIGDAELARDFHGRRQDFCCVGAAWSRAKGTGGKNRAYVLVASSYTGTCGGSCGDRAEGTGASSH